MTLRFQTLEQQVQGIEKSYRLALLNRESYPVLKAFRNEIRHVKRIQAMFAAIGRRP